MTSDAQKPLSCGPLKQVEHYQSCGANGDASSEDQSEGYSRIWRKASVEQHHDARDEGVRQVDGVARSAQFEIGQRPFLSFEGKGACQEERCGKARYKSAIKLHEMVPVEHRDERNDEHRDRDLNCYGFCVAVSKSDPHPQEEFEQYWRGVECHNRIGRAKRYSRKNQCQYRCNRKPHSSPAKSQAESKKCVEERLVIQRPAHKQDRLWDCRPVLYERHEEERANQIGSVGSRVMEESWEDQRRAKRKERENPIQGNDPRHSPPQEFPRKLVAGDYDHDKAGDYEEQIDAAFRHGNTQAAEQWLDVYCNNDQRGDRSKRLDILDLHTAHNLNEPLLSDARILPRLVSQVSSIGESELDFLHLARRA